MCLIIHKPKNKRISSSVLQKAKVVNPHGFGVTYLDSGQTYRTLSYNRVDSIVDTDRPLVCHFRYATMGDINLANVHPFAIDSNYLIYSNGTVDGFGNNDTSDIAYIAKNIIPRLRKKDWIPFLEITDTRYAIIDVNGGRVKRVGNWHELDGVHYSKNNCFTSERVAVYGTLKKGYNNHKIIKHSDFVGCGETAEKFPLLVDGLPYLYEEPKKGHQVKVEVYDVDDATLEDLDRLEGHPTFYQRKKCWIRMEDWSQSNCWVYFVQQDLPRGTTDYEMQDAYRGRYHNENYFNQYN
jgi:gamma-glutamylcyclotransferase (GGCT)/AIG2-like uncharacterized protein YtfP